MSGKIQNLFLQCIAALAGIGLALWITSLISPCDALIVIVIAFVGTLLIRITGDARNG